jgi:hypothetical protein
MRSTFAIVSIAALLVTGCNMRVKESEGKDGKKDVSISSPIGGLKVHTDDVNPADTGLTVFPGSTLKPKENEHSDNKANVAIDTPWFGLKVVAVTYLADDPTDKVWNYYRDEMSKKWGKPLECKPGSPDMDRKKEGKNELTCRDKEGKGMQIDADNSEMQLKTGTDDRQHIVAIKRDGGKTQYSLVYITVRGEKDTI